MSTQETLKGLRRRIQRREIDAMVESNPLLRVHLQPPFGGWLKAVRTSLGMSARQLGQRVGVSQASVAEAERAEAEGRITLNALRKMADGVSCDVVYAVVPRTSLDMVVHNQANQTARRLVGEVAQGMALEDQATSREDQAAQVDAVRERLVAQGSSSIWA
jgi:predicted DNA-binding mobile mystery protein A